MNEACQSQFSRGLRDCSVSAAELVMSQIITILYQYSIAGGPKIEDTTFDCSRNQNAATSLRYFGKLQRRSVLNASVNFIGFATLSGDTWRKSATRISLSTTAAGISE